MNITELKTFLLELDPIYRRWIYKNHPEEYNNILELTSFLDDNSTIKERIHCIIDGICTLLYCKTCNKVEVKYQRKTNSYNKYCSAKCSATNKETTNKRKSTNMTKYGVEHILQSTTIIEKMKESNLKKYGVENVFKLDSIKEKSKQTNLNKYGVEYPSQSEEIRNKTEITMIERYGVPHSMQSEEIRNKSKKTNLERYGVEYYSQTKEFIEKFKRTILSKYGVEHIRQLDEINEKIKNTCIQRYNATSPFGSEKIREKIKANNKIKYGVENIQQSHISHEVLEKINDKEWLIEQHYNKTKTLVKIADELGVNITSLGKHFKKHDIQVIQHGFSQAERDIIEFIKQNYNGTILENDRNIIKPKELDIVLPELNLAIEYCGLYWHSQLYVDKNYHLNKLNLCNNQNIRLITIFEDEWIHKQDIVKSKLLNIITPSSERVYARKCFIDTPTIDERRNLLESSHIQGDGAGSINLGLYHEDKLVSVMTFKKLKNNIYDLNRVASSVNVVGGFSKLLSHFKRNYKYNEIITFADRRWSEGNLYLKNGFEHVYDTKPNHFYFRNNKRFSRQKFMKHKLKDVLEVFDPNLTGIENTEMNGLNRIYDCGNMKFSLTNK